MEYAIQLLVPIGLGLMLGQWLQKNVGLDAFWTVIFAIVGMFLGMGMLYKRAVEDQLRADRRKTAPLAKGKKRATHQSNLTDGDDEGLA